MVYDNFIEIIMPLIFPGSNFGSAIYRSSGPPSNYCDQLSYNITVTPPSSYGDPAIQYSSSGFVHVYSLLVLEIDISEHV